MEEVMNDKPFFHAMVWTCFNVFLETIPGFRDYFILELLITRNPVPKGVGSSHQKVLG